ncbi:MAG: TrkH family potassium uptake protein [Betaproteobacteria bacterium]|nr:TrkH family potassium uptake protein [Betaproteobacteria bacterium]
MVRLASVLHILGLVILIIAGLMLIPLGVSCLFADGAQLAFAASSAIALCIGLLMALGTRSQARNRELQVRDGFLLAALTWLVTPAVATLPLLWQIPGLSFTDAYFETVSGLTTTGATVLDKLDALPVSINFWRTFLVWIGGMGVVVLTVAVLPLLGVGGSQAFKAETPGPMKDEKLTPRITQTAKGLWVVYAFITAGCVIGLWLAGMPAMDALMHAFSIMGLGGFSSHDDSFGFFNSPAMEAVAIFFMLLAGINFATHFLFVTRRSFRVYRFDLEAQAFWWLMLGSVLLVAYFLWRENTYAEFLTALRFAAFNVVSIATTTGLATTDYNKWPMFAPVFMIFLSCFATCAGSTGGGIKMVRAQLLVKQSYGELRRLIHPRLQVVVKLNNQVVDRSVLHSVLAFVSLYGATIILLTLLMLFSGCDVVTALTAIVACINNMGPGLNLVGPATTFAVLSDFQTWLCTLAMLLGRLELFTLLVLLSPEFWRH